MKPTAALILLIITTGLMGSGCSKFRINFLKEKNKLIAIQPLGDFDSTQSAFIREQVSHFYNRPVIVLPSLTIPANYRLSPAEELYSADSILQLLSTLANDSIAEVVGLTHADIYTTIEYGEETKRQAVPGIKKIFGMALLPGRVCIISGYRLIHNDRSVFEHRIKTVTLHEMGHNIGLTHCSLEECLMSDANGLTYVLDKNQNYYCDQCKSKLK